MSRPVAPATPRALAADLVRRVEDEGAFANLVVPSALSRATHLSAADRGLVTDLVYGSTRMRRACDWLTDRYVAEPPTGAGRAFVRIGAYQLAFTDIPPYAAVSETVAAAPRRLRPFVNAVLRKVADGPRDWPDDATRLSEPDWIVARLRADLGTVDADAALERMNLAPTVHRRPDGYVQDLASARVAAATGATRGQLAIDLCAAPGGKATAMAGAGAAVVAADVHRARAALVAGNARTTGTADAVRVVVADAERPPLRAELADVVLVDAPCSGLGALRRRPDARWRVRETEVAELAALQCRIVDAAAPLVRPGGLLVYSVCTLTRAESTGVDEHLARRRPDLVAEPPGPPWRPWGRGGLLLPQDADTDGMFLLRLRRPLPSAP